MNEFDEPTQWRFPPGHVADFVTRHRKDGSFGIVRVVLGEWLEVSGPLTRAQVEWCQFVRGA